MTDTRTKVLDAVRPVAVDAARTDQGETVERAMVRLLTTAWVDAVRAEWQAFVDADPELKAQHAVAKELMKGENYRDLDPICMMPGVKPTIAKIDNLEAVCVDVCMAQVMPLSAIFVDKVRTVQSAAARVAKALAEEAAKAPPEWPIKIASGETFNSIEEMKASPIDAVRLAQMMWDSEQYGQRPAPNIKAWEMVVVPPGFVPSDPPTCWEYFGFDGPTGYDELHAVYSAKIAGIQPDDNHKLASGIGKQYQNCLREIGAALLDCSNDGK